MAKKLTARETLAALRKEHNADHTVIGTLADFDMEISGYSTGNLSLDFVTGVGGYPQGRIVEQFGLPSSGKTTSALMAMGQEQQRIISEGDEESVVMFLDYERSIDPVYCKKLGLDTDHPSFVYIKPLSFEHGASLFRAMLETGGVRIAVFDSVAAMVSEKEKEADTGAATVADRAKMLHQFCRQIKDDVDLYGTTAIFLNHTMEKVATDQMSQRLAARGIKQWTQPGGKALPFYASLRIEYKQVGKVKTKQLDALTNTRDDEQTGQDIEAIVVKNKAADPFRIAKLRVRRGKGFSQSYSVLQVLLSHDVVRSDKSGYYFFPESLTPSKFKGKVSDGVFKIRTEELVLKAMDSEPEWMELCLTEARSLLEQFGLPKVDGSNYNADGTEKIFSSSAHGALFTDDDDTEGDD